MQLLSIFLGMLTSLLVHAAAGDISVQEAAEKGALLLSIYLFISPLEILVEVRRSERLVEKASREKQV